MNKTGIALHVACCLSLPAAAQAAPMVSHFPQQGLGQFLADRFDLASVRSSFGPRRTPSQRTFADFQLQPTWPRALGMAQKIDWILHGEIRPLDAELKDTLREAVAISAAIRNWQQEPKP